MMRLYLRSFQLWLVYSAHSLLSVIFVFLALFVQGLLWAGPLFGHTKKTVNIKTKTVRAWLNKWLRWPC